MNMSRISKSQYIRGLQCPKALWYYRHRPDLMPEISDSRQAIFDAGNEVGKLAQQYFGDGIENTEEHFAVERAIAATEQAINDGHENIFEPTAESGGAFKLSEKRIIRSREK